MKTETDQIQPQSSDQNDALEPLDFDWDRCCPPWFDFIAMHEDGTWCAYTPKPIQCLWVWYWDSNTHSVLEIHPDYEPKNYTGDWKDSLRKRPE